MEKLHECCKGKAKEKILHKASKYHRNFLFTIKIIIVSFYLQLKNQAPAQQTYLFSFFVPTNHHTVAELMILGIISFVTVNVIQIEVACESPLIDMVLAEFEMAHVWLFFVGIMYILNTIIFVITLEWVKTSWDLCDAM